MKDLDKHKPEDPELAPDDIQIHSRESVDEPVEGTPYKKPVEIVMEGDAWDDINEHAQEDLKNERVRFIGDACERITEDALRILRFFRFSARFSKSFDADGLAACAELKSGIANLSAERVGDDLGSGSQVSPGYGAVGDAAHASRVPKFLRSGLRHSGGRR